MVSRREGYAVRSVDPAERPRGLGLVLPVLALLFSALLALIHGGYLLLLLFGWAFGNAADNVWAVGLAALAVVSVSGLLCALTALRIALDYVRGGGKGLVVMLAWQVLSVFLILATAFLALLEGPK